jgi:hypothetical protein
VDSIKKRRRALAQNSAKAESLFANPPLAKANGNSRELKLVEAAKLWQFIANLGQEFDNPTL